MLVNGREKRHESPKSHCTRSRSFSFLAAFDSGSFAIPGWVRRASFSCACRRLPSTSVLAPCVAVKLFCACKFFGSQAFAFYPIGFHRAQDSPELPNVCGDGIDVCGWLLAWFEGWEGSSGSAILITGFDFFFFFFCL